MLADLVAAQDDLRTRPSDRADSCFALAEQLSEEPGVAQLVIVRSDSPAASD